MKKCKHSKEFIESNLHDMDCGFVKPDYCKSDRDCCYDCIELNNCFHRCFYASLLERETRPYDEEKSWDEL
jgi:hypothetical protein